MRGTVIVLPSSGSGPENKIGGEFRRVKPSRVPVRILHVGIDPGHRVSQGVVDKVVASICYEDSEEIEHLVLSETGQGMENLEIDVHPEYRRVIFIQYDVLERYAEFWRYHLIQECHDIQREIRCPVSYRFKLLRLEIEVDIVVRHQICVCRLSRNDRRVLHGLLRSRSDRISAATTTHD